MTIREKIEELERQTLSPFAALSAESRGRAVEEEPCSMRTDFQRDRDRIIHRCKAFRRLSQKTQVFISPRMDHYRTRLHHTLEVAQIARTLAKALRLNEDLTEAIALGHDLGHPPFGHAGESALDEVYREFHPDAHFRHNEQSLRVVDVLEQDGKGLNLTQEVREGILYHAKGQADSLEVVENDPPQTLEGNIVKIADRIAYVNHDLDDAMRAGLIREEDIPQEPGEVLGRTHSERIGTMVKSIIEHSYDRPYIKMEAEVVAATNLLKDFLFERVYLSVIISEGRVRKITVVLKGLFEHYMEQWGKTFHGEQKDLARRVCDHIAGMTDRYAMSVYVKLFVPDSWGGWESEVVVG